MKFEPKTEDQLNNFNLIDEGQYKYKVVEAVDTVSRSGDDQIKLTLLIIDKQGNERKVKDYLNPKMIHKIKHFCDSNNLKEKYSQGNLEAKDCFGKIGILDLIIQKGKAIPDDAQGKYFNDQNSVQDYLASDNVQEKDGKKEELNDDIPF
jgi:hypothetical protein